MNNLTFTFDVRIERSCEAFLKLRPQHLWRFLTSIKQILGDFVCLTNINGMNANSITMLDKAIVGLVAVVYLLQALDLGFCSVIFVTKLTKKVWTCAIVSMANESPIMGANATLSRKSLWDVGSASSLSQCI